MADENVADGKVVHDEPASSVAPPPKQRRPFPPGWTSHHHPDNWKAAHEAYSSGWTPPPVFIPVGLGGVFKTAEDVQKMLDLDTVPETIETYTITLGANRRPVLVKYCIVSEAYWMDLRQQTYMDDGAIVMMKGKQRHMYTPTALKRKLKDGKLKRLHVSY